MALQIRRAYELAAADVGHDLGAELYATVEIRRREALGAVRLHQIDARVPRHQGWCEEAEGAYHGRLGVEVGQQFSVRVQRVYPDVSAAEHPIQVEGSADQRKMRKGLREIAQRFTLRTRLFGVEAEMVGIAEHPFKQKPRFIEFLGNGLTRARQRFDKPEGAHVEGAFLARKPIDAIRGRIAVDQTVADQTAVARTREDR